MNDEQHALGLLETTGFTPAIVALDAMEKAGAIQVFQAELNDFLGVIIKVLGPVSDVRAAVAIGHRIADELHGSPVSSVIVRPDDVAWAGISSAVEYNPLIQQDVVHQPQETEVNDMANNQASNSDTSFAIGFIETQGFTAVFEAIDTACKTAGVEVIGKEKLGGGYVTVIIKGDVAAVSAAVDAGAEKVEGLGKLIASHVIARPSAGVLSLLPTT